MMTLIAAGVMSTQLASGNAFDVHAARSAERLVLERFPSGTIRRLEIERYDDEVRAEVEILLGGRQGFLLAEHDEGEWELGRVEWRSTSARYRRLLSRIESEPRGVSLSQAVSAALQAHPRAKLSEIELEFQDARLVYEVELRQGLVEFDTHLDASSGRLLTDPAAASLGRIDEVIAALPESCEAGVPVAFFHDVDAGQFVVDSRGEDEAAREGLEPALSLPPCNEMRTKLELLQRIFPGDVAELWHGSLEFEGGWVLRCVVFVGGAEVEVVVDGQRQTLVARLGAADAEP